MIKTQLSTMVGGAGIWTPGCTVIGSVQKTLDQLIKSLFANNEQGFTRTPDDLTTLYQDAAGTIPVTAVGQPVGLMLDKSKGLALGPEKLTNPNFSNGLLDWTAATGGWSVVNGRAYHANSSVYNELSQNLTPTAKACVVQFDYQAITVPASVNIAYINALGATKILSLPTVAGTFKFVAFDGIQKLAFSRVFGQAAEFYIDNVSIKELAGNHAYQTTSSMRPLLQYSPRRIDYDAVDDKLITNLPAQLSGCTVIRSIPNVGTQILINQTIATPYNDSTDHCGLIVINRALTATETAQITRLFNKAAGV